MIRMIGSKEDPFGYLDMMEERLNAMETLASTHITWYTHKNPYGCWICDMFLLGHWTIASFRVFLGPIPAIATEEFSGLKSESTKRKTDLLEDDSEFYDEHDKEETEGL